MSDFRIWSTIHQIAPAEFMVTVSAVPDDLAALPDGVKVDMHSATTRVLAVEACADMVLKMGRRLRDRGGRVIDVEAE